MLSRRYSTNFLNAGDYRANTMKNVMREVAKRCPRQQLPVTYLVIDIETSGFSWKSTPPSVITQVGFATITDCKLTHNEAVLLKRPAGTMLHNGHQSKASEVTGITDETLKDGADPREFYEGFIKLLEMYRAQPGCMFVGHNFLKFDMPFLNAEFRKYNLSFQFEPNEAMDTGMLFKATQMRSVPGPHEDLYKYQKRIADTRSKIKWNLGLAMETLGLIERHKLDMDAAHDAGFDCLMTHLLFEEMRLIHDGS